MWPLGIFRKQPKKKTLNRKTKTFNHFVFVLCLYHCNISFYYLSIGFSFLSFFCFAFWLCVWWFVSWNKLLCRRSKVYLFLWIFAKRTWNHHPYWIGLSNLQTFMIFLFKRRVKILQSLKSSNFQIVLCQRRVESCSIQIFKLAWFWCKRNSLILQSSNLKTCMIFSAKQGSNLKLPKSSRPFLLEKGLIPSPNLQTFMILFVDEKGPSLVQV
jgi:hypothetical protein